MVNRPKIEKEARLLQFEIWQHRKILFKFGVPPLHLMFQPSVAADVLQISLNEVSRIDSGQSGVEVAGTLDVNRGIITVSSRFKPQVRRFTAAHEIGHYQLHKHLGNSGIIHRDRPVHDLVSPSRPLIEQEADYFGACLLAPAKLVREEFALRFGANALRLDEVIAWHLCGDSYTDLFAEPRRLKFAAALAGASKLDRHHFPSLSTHFDMSPSAMAIRLHELDLVID